MFLANRTRPDNASTVNLLERHSAAPTKRHWAGGKQILRYLNGTKDLGLFFQKAQDSSLVGYTDDSYISGPHNARSQTGFVFLHGATAIHKHLWLHPQIILRSWHYMKPRECVWLHRMINHIEQSCGIGSMKTPTIIYEDNTAFVTQMQTCYIKSNMTKHITPKLLFPA